MLLTVNLFRHPTLVEHGLYFMFCSIVLIRRTITTTTVKHLLLDQVVLTDKEVYCYAKRGWSPLLVLIYTNFVTVKVHVRINMLRLYVPACGYGVASRQTLHRPIILA